MNGSAPARAGANTSRCAGDPAGDGCSPASTAPEPCGASRWLCALRTFRTVVRERGFTAAARRLGVSQGAVSQQMRCLEAQLGVRLLDRSAHRVELTAAGERLLWHAERLLDAQDARLAEVAHLRARPAEPTRPEILHSETPE